MANLSHRTKFGLAVLVQLPFDANWFGVAPGLVPRAPLPKMGMLHPSYMAAVARALGQGKP